MMPALLLVADPRPGAAVETLDRMLALRGVDRRACTAAARADDWAAACMAPRASEPTCGGDVLDIGSDLLIWAGEMFVHSHWITECQLPMAGFREPAAQTIANRKSETGSGASIRQISAAVLEQLKTHGLAALGQIDGGFCGAWLDRLARRWFIFDDKLGQAPLFWSADDDRLVVSPQAWLTWRGMGAPLRICRHGVADLIRTQNMCDDHTLIENVRWLPRGQALCWGDEGVGYCRYWDFDYTRGRIEDADEALDSYLETFTAAMRRHASTSGQLLLGISGGLDSRLFLAMGERIGRVPRCFTAGWPFYEDVRFGRRLARVAGAAHDLVSLDEHALPERLEAAIIDTDGLQSAAHLPPLLPIRPYLHERAGAVLLDGFFNGLVGGGTVPADETPGVAPHQTHWARSRLHSGGEIDFVNALLQPALARESQSDWESRIDLIYRTAPAVDSLSRAEYTMVHGRTGRVDVLGTRLLRDDVLVRNPASDRAMLDWHQRVSPRLRRARALYVAALRKVFPRYARVPRADGCGALPVAANRLLREYYWQMDRLHRWYARARYSVARRHGTSSAALRSWALDVWRRSGRLDILREPTARILEWVRRESLLDLWRRSAADARSAEQVLTLATLEVMIRRLESQPASQEVEPQRRSERTGETIGTSQASSHFQSLCR